MIFNILRSYLKRPFSSKDTKNNKFLLNDFAFRENQLYTYFCLQHSLKFSSAVPIIVTGKNVFEINVILIL